MAIGMALATYSSERAREVKQKREEYLAFVAHDLQTPLLAISLAGRVLENRLQTAGFTADFSKMLKTLRRSVMQLEGLVRRVLEENINLAGDDGIKVERREFDLWPLVESLLDEIGPVAGEAKASLVNKVPDDLAVFADAGLLKRVFQNLVVNAIRYTPGGEIVVGALDSGLQGGIDCWVSDNGAGIPQALLDNVFKKGESDPDNAEGTGLGLAIVQTFVEAHGGSVSVESTEGKGSTFRFSLPAKATA